MTEVRAQEIPASRLRFEAADVLKFLALAASVLWASATFITKQDLHGTQLADHETRLRSVELMQPQVQAIYRVIVEGKKPRELDRNQK